MREKALHNGLCLQCGRESKQPFCNRTCYREYVRSDGACRKKSEKCRRDSLTDIMVRKTIYIVANKKIKGTLKWDDITPEMIIEKRKQILEWRNRKNNPVIKKKEIHICKICGNEFESRGSYCSDECRKENSRRKCYNHNKASKDLIQRKCGECGVVFTPEYGNKKKSFCSHVCLNKNLKRRRRQKERARLRKVKIENVNAIEVFMRDGWRCQLCGKKLNKKHRGTYKDGAPELDHIIPLSRGGDHSRKNTQCACRRCNAEKGDRERGQERLFG